MNVNEKLKRTIRTMFEAGEAEAHLILPPDADLHSALNAFYARRKRALRLAPDDPFTIFQQQLTLTVERHPSSTILTIRRLEPVEV